MDTFSDFDRLTAKRAGMVLFAVVIEPPDHSDPTAFSYQRSGSLTPDQAEELAKAVNEALRKIRNRT